MPAQLLKGALAKVNRRGAITRCFVFALNPEQINRRIHWPEQPAAAGETAPRERVAFKLVLDAVDAPEDLKGKRRALQHGIRPQLSALESFIRPLKAPLRQNQSHESTGPRALAPTLAFMWGREPIIPVWMVSLNVREELFDPALNPLRASVWVELEVLRSGSGRADFVAKLSEASASRINEMAALAWAPAPPQMKTSS